MSQSEPALPTDERILTTSDLFASVRVHWRTAAWIALATTAAAVIVGLLLPNRWSATAIMSLQPVSVTTGKLDINMETERVVASSASVANLAAESLDGISSATLMDALEVRVPRGSQALELVVVLDDPDEAATAANAVATAYGEVRVTNAERAVDAAVNDLVQQISDLEQTAESVGPDSVEGRAAIIQADALKEALASINRATYGPGTILSEATPPDEPTKPSIYVFLAAGLALGLMAGVLVVQALARRRANRMTAPSQVDEPEPVSPKRSSKAAVSAKSSGAELTSTSSKPSA